VPRFERLAAGHAVDGFVSGQDELDEWVRQAAWTADRAGTARAVDDRARSFYEHFNFRPIPDNPHRLVMKASTAAASLSLDWP